MPFDIPTLSNLERTQSNLADLSPACRVRGPLFCHEVDPTNDVVRKAKGLSTSLGKLRAAVGDPNHKPLKEEPVPKDPLELRHFFQPKMYELARHISYGGRRDKDVRAKCDDMRTRFPERKVMMAVHELTVRDEATGLTVLRPHVRHLCRGLLGPAPEDPGYERYNAVNHREPPPEHQPPGPEVEPPAAPAKKRGRGR